jgi:hypothetical protein
MKHPRKWIWLLAASIAFAVPLSALAVDIPVPAKVYLVKQDKNNGFVGKLAKIVNKPAVKGGTFVLPSSAPTTVGGTLRFFKNGVPGTWESLSLPFGQWQGLGNPPGSKGYKYRGAGSLTDPCKSVLVKEKVIKATCKGANSTDSPMPFSLPVNQTLGAGWELVIGTDRYCALSSTGTGSQVKKNDASKGLYKTIKSNAPLVCPDALAPTPTPPPPPTPSPPPTPTPPYGSASKAFLNPAPGLLE